jgi:hypothetical protein
MNNNGMKRTRGAGVATGGKPIRLRKVNLVDPNDLIDSIVDAIDYAEIAKDAQGLNKARRLLNNDLRQAIDVYVQDEVTKALKKAILPADGAQYARTLAFKHYE